MSNHLQLTCPKCSTRLNVAAPSGETGRAKCGGCGHTFAFRVPKQPTTVQAVAPLAETVSSTNDPFSGIPSSPQQPPPRPVNPPKPIAAHHRPASVAPHSPAGPKRPSSGKRGTARWLTFALLAFGLVGFATIGTATWYLLGKAKLIPASMNLFDAPSAILTEADASDRELQRLVMSIQGDFVSDELLEKLAFQSRDAKQLVGRAIRLTPLSEQDAIELFEAHAAVSPDAELSSDVADGSDERVAESPLSTSETADMQEKVRGLKAERRVAVAGLVGSGLKASEFVREYLRHGHLELPDPVLPGEEIAAERIEILRRVNLLAANASEKFDPDKVYDAKAEKKLMTDEEIEDYVNDLYAPIVDDVTEAAERMHQLAADRYALDSSEAGDTKQYDEILYYTNQVSAQVFGSHVMVTEKDEGILKAFGELLMANRDVDRAERGTKPSRIAKVDQEAAEREQRELERQNKIAAEKRKRDLEVANERRIADAESARLAEQRAATERAASEQAAADRAAMENATDGTASTNPSDGDGSVATGIIVGPGAFGPGGRGPSGFRGGPPFGPSRGGPPRMGPSGPGPRFGPSRGRQPPAMPDMTGGVIIKMEDASNSIEVRDIHGKFATLKCAINSSMRNGSLTIRLAHKGDLDAVVKLIDFGKVVSKDAKTRTIVLEPKED